MWLNIFSCTLARTSTLVLVFSLRDPRHRGRSWKRFALAITACRTANTKILQIGAATLRGSIAAIRPRSRPSVLYLSAGGTRDERATWPFLNGPHYPDKPSYRSLKRYQVIAINFIWKMERWSASRYGKSISIQFIAISSL